MTDQNQPGENGPAEAPAATPSAQVAEALGALAAGTEGPATPPKRTRTRRATAPRSAPASADAATDAPAAVDTPAPVADAPAAESAPDAAPAPARRTRSRKAAPKAAAAEQPAPIDAPPTPEPEPEATDAAPDAPAKPARTRRRATSKEVAPEVASAEDATSTTTTKKAGTTKTGTTTTGTTKTTTKKAGASKSRAGGKSAGKSPATADGGAPVEAESSVTPEAQTASTEQPAEAEASTTARVGGTARLATTALLFQAPEPTARPRRRRASAPAGPPRHPDEAQTPAEVAPVEDDTLATDETEAELVVVDVDAEVVDEETAEAQGDDETSEEGEAEEGAPARRRRRRGGRGRRGRSSASHESDGEGDDEQDGSEDAAAETTEGSEPTSGTRSGRRRGARAEAKADAEPDEQDQDSSDADADEGDGGGSPSRRRRRRRRSREAGDEPAAAEPRASRSRVRTDEVTALKGSTRLEAKRQRRREGRDAGRRRAVITEAEFLARRESVERTMVVRENDSRVQIAIVEDGVLVEHYVSRTAANSGAPMAGNVYLGRVQNVLPSMEAAFVDIGKGRNAVLYAGEVNWDAAGLEGQPRRIEQALKSGDPVLVQVTKEPVGHKGARLTSQITLAGRYLVYVPGGGMTGISRKLPDTERARLKRILKEIVPDDAGVIVRTAAEGASDEELRRDVQRLQDQWAAIEKKSKTASAPALLQGEPDLAIRVVRDVFNDDFTSLVVQGADAWQTVSDYVGAMAPDLAEKISRWTKDSDLFAAYRIDEQLAKGMDRKVWLPSGGSLVIDRTEAMTVIDVNTGKFTGSGGTLEETVTRNNLEAAEEIVRQLRLRDIGGIIVIDFIDMVLESNRDLVLRRLVECLGRDRTKHQVAEVTSLGLVQMTRKRVGQGLLEAFSEQCQHCNGRGFIIHSEPVSSPPSDAAAPAPEGEAKRSRRKKSGGSGGSGGNGGTTASASIPVVPVLPEAREAVKATLATIAAAAAHAHEHGHDEAPAEQAEAADPVEPVEAAEMVEAAEGAKAAESVEQTGSTDLIEPVEGTEPAEAVDVAAAVEEDESAV